ncbi:HET-domain-containing protein, partial [Trametes versicolor FP-101664 SS1]|uniref:HET-domain-containing protein n=1 Tax=Trametes versicolor (strain FP-101664) TaxID=717944 RepID=UPI0004622127
YLALSYVWGEDQIHKTTRSNLSTYKRGIEPSLLPATIRDAIRVTHMLGFRWLWVDSLCILQDSDEDKLHEVGRMHNIYRYAHLTIIAASADKASEGFLHTRSPPEDEIVLPFICPPNTLDSTGCRDDHFEAQPQSGTVCFGPESLACNSYSDDFGLMCKRAWCMQEYLVSPRSLIFTPRTLHFRCLTGMRGVGEGSLGPAYDKPQIPQTLFLQDPPVAKPGSPEWIDMHEAWLEVVGDYSSRTASVESDKLVACAAVAEQFHRVLRSDYLAGLWRSDALLIDLVWTTVELEDPIPERPLHIRPTAYRAPSWSWAAIEGDVCQSFPITSYYDGGGIALAKIIDCRVTLQDAALPFGRVTGGMLVL